LRCYSIIQQLNLVVNFIRMMGFEKFPEAVVFACMGICKNRNAAEPGFQVW
jgi:hypothetical protein